MGKTINHKYDDELEECRKEYNKKNKKNKKKMTRKQYEKSPEGRLMSAIYGSEEEY